MTTEEKKKERATCGACQHPRADDEDDRRQAHLPQMNDQQIFGQTLCWAGFIGRCPEEPFQHVALLEAQLKAALAVISAYGEDEGYVPRRVKGSYDFIAHLLST